MTHPFATRLTRSLLTASAPQADAARVRLKALASSPSRQLAYLALIWAF